MTSTPIMAPTTVPITIPILDPEVELTHRPGDDPSFQESALFVWHDLAAGVGGFWRLGQEPVVGALNSCFGIFTADGLRFRSNVTGVPMAASDRGEAYMGWGSQLRLHMADMRIEAAFGDCEASLRFEDFFPRYDWFALMKRPVPGGGVHHFEVAGHMSGKLRLGTREFEINALGYRDRSWGARRWDFMRGTRWWPSVFGPDLCVFLTASVHEQGHGAYGYMIKDGVPQALSQVDVAATLDYDALSPRSGHGRFLLADGTPAEIHHERSDGIVLHVRGYTAVESIGTTRLGDRIGMSNFEVSTNPAGGNKPPVVVLGANYGDGLSQRATRAGPR